MRLSDLTKMVFRNLSRSKFRAFLTMMGVVIGTAAIIAMVSIGIGLQENITGQLESFGDVSLIWVFPGGAFGQGEEKKLEDEDILEFEKIEGVITTTPLMIIDAELQLRRGISKTSIYGIEPKKAEIIGQEVKRGRYLRRGDTLDMVAGAKVSETFREEKTKDPISKVDLFGKTLKITFERINDEGDVEEKTYKVKVVGIAEEKGSDDDYNVYMPIETVTEMIEWRYEERNYIKKNGYFLAWVKVENVDSIQMVQDEIEEMGYVTRSLKQVIDFIGDVFITLQLIFAAIGAIALIVAALGIINTMVMSIYERYREIGIMKTVGGSNTDIMKLFILEAGVIGLFGGIGGVITGFGIGKLIDLAANLYLQQGGATESQTIVVIPLWLMFGAMVFAMFIGLVAGVYPAMRAAKLSPIDALRHE